MESPLPAPKIPQRDGGVAAPSPPEPTPAEVVYLLSKRDFYDALTREWMGPEFYAKWKTWAPLFPTEYPVVRPAVLARDFAGRMTDYEFASARLKKAEDALAEAVADHAEALRQLARYRAAMLRVLHEPIDPPVSSG